MKRIDAVLNRRRAPDEFAIPEVAILNFCSECMGFQPALIAGCTAPECWLYPLRLGVGPVARQKAMSPPAIRLKSRKIPPNESGPAVKPPEDSSHFGPSGGPSGMEGPAHEISARRTP